MISSISSPNILDTHAKFLQMTSHPMQNSPVDLAYVQANAYLPGMAFHGKKIRDLVQ
jgi:hypothetical protein